MYDATSCFAHLAETWRVGEGGVRSVPGDLQQNHPRVDSMYRFPVELPFAETLVSQGHDDDVGPFDEAVCDISAGFVMKVERHRALVSAGHLKPQRDFVALGAHLPGSVTDARWLDVNHVCTLVGEQRAGHRARHDVSELDDLEPVKLPASKGEVFVRTHKNSLDLLCTPGDCRPSARCGVGLHSRAFIQCRSSNTGALINAF